MKIKRLRKVSIYNVEWLVSGIRINKNTYIVIGKVIRGKKNES